MIQTNLHQLFKDQLENGSETDYHDKSFVKKTELIQ